MATIRATLTQESAILEADHIVGRLPNSSLLIDEDYVSKRHAMLRFSGEHWEIRDLGSRNGTFVNGARIKAGEDTALQAGFRIAFGKVEQEWELVDDLPPTAMVVPLAGGPPVLIDAQMLALPSADDPRVTIYANAEGGWMIEQPDSSIEIANQQTFEVDRRMFRFSCPDAFLKTASAAPLLELEVRHLYLTFSVSRDEEFVQLRAAYGNHQFDLGSRQHNYLLLTLARRRRDDAAEGLPETACGWLYLDDLAHDPMMAQAQVNIDVHRIRKQFEAIGVLDPANVVERRQRTKQVRLGVPRFSIVTL